MANDPSKLVAALQNESLEVIQSIFRNAMGALQDSGLETARQCMDANDFGDVATLFKQLKRCDIEAMMSDADVEPSFGAYGGCVNGWWIVFVWGLRRGEIVPVLSTTAPLTSPCWCVLGYHTLENLKQNWQLD